MFDHSERVLDLGADMCLGRFDQILQPAIGGIREGSAFARSHCHPKLRCHPFHLGSLGNALVAGIAVHHLFIAMQQLSRRGEVMHVGGRGDNRVDQTRVLIDADMDLHSEIPLVALLGLVHLQIALPLFVLSGAGCRDQGGIHDRALPHRHASRAEVGFDRLKDPFAQFVLLQQVTKGQDRGLIGDPITDQLDAGKAEHGGHLDQGLLHGRITQRIPLLQQVDAQHGVQRIGRPAALLAGLGAVGLNQGDQRLPGHHYLHLRKKPLPFGLLFGGGDLVIR